MRSAKWSIILALAVTAIATPSAACRVALPPEQRIAMGYQRGTISAVLLVQVKAAKYTAAAFSDAHPWQATATVERVLRGSYPAKVVRFTRGWGSAACDDGHPVAKSGEKWVVYLWKRRDGDQTVWQTYPARIAFAADPRLWLNAR